MKLTTKPAKLFQQRRSRFNKRFAFLLALLLLLLSGCNKTVIATGGDAVDQKEPVQSAALSQSIRIGRSANDSLNPFFMQTDLNMDFISLVFEPLFYIDDSFCAVNGLALSYTQEEKTLTVKIDTSAAFSDGVQFSSSDVVYSFNLAKSSENYSSELTGMESATAASADTVVFTLAESYRNAVDSLTFPIVKTNSAQNAQSVPLGTGLYTYSLSGEELTLTYNPYCRKPEPNIRSIRVVQVDTVSTLIHTLETGVIDAYFDDLSSGSYSLSNAATARTNLPNLVFLGMNSASYGVNSASFRQAVYYALNRQSIVKNSFKNCAVESYTPFHPEWHAMEEESYDTSALALDYAKAQTLLQNAGFSSAVNLKLIVYTGNNFKVAAAKEIQESLQNININITIEELTWENYKLALSNGDYDLYIGEVKLPNTMNLSALFGSGSVIYGTAASDTTASAYDEYKNGNISLASFTNSFLQNMPFAPICFRQGALVYAKTIYPAADCDIGNVYKNIYEWNIRETASQTAP